MGNAEGSATERGSAGCDVSALVVLAGRRAGTCTVVAQYDAIGAAANGKANANADSVASAESAEVAAGRAAWGIGRAGAPAMGLRCEREGIWAEMDPGI